MKYRKKPVVIEAFQLRKGLGDETGAIPVWGIAAVVKGTIATAEGWWYENARSIDIFMHDKLSGMTVRGRINRSDLEDWLKRTKPTKRR